MHSSIVSLHLNSKKGRGRPPGRKNNNTRSDRQDACRRVAEVLVQEPLSSLQRLADLAFPVATDKKARKTAHQRARRALADLSRRPELAGPKLTERVRAALAEREAEAERRQERERRAEDRLKEMPAAALLRRLLAIPEVREEIGRVVRAKRQFAGQEMWWSFPVGPEQIPATVELAHPEPKLAGKIMTSSEATWRVGAEIHTQRKISCLVTIPFFAAQEIFSINQKLQQKMENGDAAGEDAAREELRRAVRDALTQAGWADPTHHADQVLETLEARRKREADAARAGFWPIFFRGGLVDLTPEKVDTWPRRWQGKPLQTIQSMDELADLLGAGKLERLHLREARGVGVTEDFTVLPVGPGGGKRNRGGGRADKNIVYQKLS